MERQYLAIDLKSFYASVECVERGLDPMTANLVVADMSRTTKTICLAVSPHMKALGVRNRCRVFEIPEGIDYVAAKPRMALYMERSADIYSVYLRYVSPDDMHVYSIDEAFLDVTGYLDLYGCTARELGQRIREDVVRSTGIPATCGLGTNLYLAKVALDITAKHSEDFFGELDEERYRFELWNHRPITDFWRIGAGYARRLAEMGLHTMGQVATYPKEPLYRAFGIDAEILIDHAWGREPVTIKDIKGYRSSGKSLTNGQVLGCDVSFDTARIIVKEMVDALALDLVDQRLVCSSVSISVGYRLTRDEKEALFATGGVGPKAAAHAGEHGLRFRWSEFADAGSVRLVVPTNSLATMWEAAVPLFESIADRRRMVHRLTVVLGDVLPEGSEGMQMDLFADRQKLARERKRQEAVSAIKHKFGKNSLLKGMDLLPGATARERNATIGGHCSGEEERARR